MDVDDDDEYINAAAAHAVFVMTVSAARMYWLLRHAQHARDINIHKLHPFPKNRLVPLCRFSTQWNRLHWNSGVCSMPISITIFCVVEHPLSCEHLGFYRAMLWDRGICYGRVSVRLSVIVTVTSRCCIKIAKQITQITPVIVWGFYLLMPNVLLIFQWSRHWWGRQVRVGWKNLYLSTNISLYLKTVQVIDT